ncbi:MT-A70 family protein [Oxytricha trifallax]|uniref:mRNA m(6)A methyltransferase n=1 Tax=Oxytricha trifallax TaxID=1172189 RepID=A0A073HZ00_9SPIT|nr:MT-A70 family protein [Oxytricha trifallax]
MGRFKGPAEILIKISKFQEIQIVIQTEKKLIYKLLSEPLVFEGDVRDLNMWEMIGQDCMERNNSLYEVIMIDPPQRLLQQDLPYPTLSDKEILDMSLHLVQKYGIMILWIVNSKRELAKQFILKNGYRKVDRGEWVKLTKNGVLYTGWGKYTAHCNESFIIGVKGDVKNIVQFQKAKSVFLDSVGDHLVKPEKIYEFIQMITSDRPNLEIFGRKKNLRRGWTTFGNNLH